MEQQLIFWSFMCENFKIYQYSEKYAWIIENFDLVQLNMILN